MNLDVKFLLRNVDNSLILRGLQNIIEERVIVAGVAVPKSLLSIKILKLSGIVRTYPDAKDSFRVLSKTLFIFSTHSE
jgi:hypothetical protein